MRFVIRKITENTKIQTHCIKKSLHLGLLLLSHNGNPIQLLFGKEKQLLFSMTLCAHYLSVTKPLRLSKVVIDVKHTLKFNEAIQCSFLILIFNQSTQT